MFHKRRVMGADDSGLEGYVSSPSSEPCLPIHRPLPGKGVLR